MGEHGVKGQFSLPVVSGLVLSEECGGGGEGVVVLVVVEVVLVILLLLLLPLFPLLLLLLLISDCRRHLLSPGHREQSSLFAGHLRHVESGMLSVISLRPLSSQGDTPDTG